MRTVKIASQDSSFKLFIKQKYHLYEINIIEIQPNFKLILIYGFYQYSREAPPEKSLVSTMIVLNTNIIITKSTYETGVCINELSSDSRFNMFNMDYWEKNFTFNKDSKNEKSEDENKIIPSKDYKLIYKNTFKRTKRVSFSIFEAKEIGTIYRDTLYFERNCKKEYNRLFDSSENLLKLFVNSIFGDNCNIYDCELEKFIQDYMRDIDSIIKHNNDYIIDSLKDDIDLINNNENPNSFIKQIEQINNKCKMLNNDDKYIVLYDLDKINYTNLSKLYKLISFQFAVYNYANQFALAKTLLFIDKIKTNKIVFYAYTREIAIKRSYKLDVFLLTAFYCYQYHERNNRNRNFETVLSLIYIIIGFCPELSAMYGKELGQSLSKLVVTKVLDTIPNTMESCITSIKNSNKSDNSVLKVIESTKLLLDFEEEFMDANDFEANEYKGLEKPIPIKLENLKIKIVCI